MTMVDFNIGETPFDHGVRGVNINLDALLGSRMLIQAMSGAGKSYALKRIFEQTHGAVQQFIIDPEGEFPAMRGLYDYVVVAKSGGDAMADPRSAALLAERLLELGVSAVLDIYELKRDRRLAFVENFCNALTNAPRPLWHPVMIGLDEAHVFCPEGTRTDCGAAVIDLATRGRKRGFCLIAATQRLSKFHKDAAAELGNKLVGRTVLDVDLQRAGDDLGLRKPDWDQLRRLEDGEFFGFGPAISKHGVVKFKVGLVATPQQKAGSLRSIVVPPPTEKIRAMLAKIADLPAEVEAKVQTEAELRAALADARRNAVDVDQLLAWIRDPNAGLAEADRFGQASLERKIAYAVDYSRSQVEPTPEPVLLREEAQELRDVLAAVRAEAGPLADILVGRLKAELDGYTSSVRNVAERLERKLETVTAPSADKPIPADPLWSAGVAAHRSPQDYTGRPPRKPQEFQPPPPKRTARTDAAVFEGGVTGSQIKILNQIAVVAARGLQPNVVLVARWLGIHPKGGRYNSDLAALRRAGLLDGLSITPAGMKYVKLTDRRTLAEVPVDGTKRAILNVLVNNYHKLPMNVAELAEKLGIHPKGGRFNSDIAYLRAMGLVPERGGIFLTPAAGQL